MYEDYESDLRQMDRDWREDEVVTFSKEKDEQVKKTIRMGHIMNKHLQLSNPDFILSFSEIIEFLLSPETKVCQEVVASWQVPEKHNHYQRRVVEYCFLGKTVGNEIDQTHIKVIEEYSLHGKTPLTIVTTFPTTNVLCYNC